MSRRRPGSAMGREGRRAGDQAFPAHGTDENPTKPGGIGGGVHARGVRFDDYATDPDSHYDEMFSNRGKVRPLYRALAQRMAELTPAEFEGRKKTVDLLLRNQGVT